MIWRFKWQQRIPTEIEKPVSWINIFSNTFGFSLSSSTTIIIVCFVYNLWNLPENRSIVPALAIHEHLDWLMRINQHYFWSNNSKLLRPWRRFFGNEKGILKIWSFVITNSFHAHIAPFANFIINWMEICELVCVCVCIYRKIRMWPWHWNVNNTVKDFPWMENCLRVHLFLITTQWILLSP